MPASWGVNPLATSHTADNLSSICLHSVSHDQPIFYLISHCLNKKAVLGTPGNHQKMFFLFKQKGIK